MPTQEIDEGPFGELSDEELQSLKRIVDMKITKEPNTAGQVLALFAVTFASFALAGIIKARRESRGPGANVDN